MIKALLLDMDGVIYRGDQALPGAAGFLPALQRAGVSVILVTNNSTRTATGVAAKLAQMGIQAPVESILTSAQATARWLHTQAPAGAGVYIVGSADLANVVLEQPGFQIDAERPDFVVVGLDTEVTYAKLRTASLGLLRGARFVATNVDSSLPVEGGELWPGAGAIVAAIATTVGRPPDVILGKPEPWLFQQALEILKLPPAAVLAVGDRAETDIVAGKRAGVPTALVLTGVTRPDEVAGLAPEMRPDYVFKNLEELRAFACAVPTPAPKNPDAEDSPAVD
ncbi:MAG TPA: HAD-IIA family hydrolase [Chloroflexia bacterium]|nr:HAD-IIA family hydrolase [Chloroflexia bacterium]